MAISKEDLTNFVYEEQDFERYPRVKDFQPIPTGKPMNALSLFAGIGGLDLAGSWAGINTVAFCERERYCQLVLKKNFGKDIPIFDDVKTLTKEKLDEKKVPQIHIVTGGFPLIA